MSLVIKESFLPAWFSNISNSFENYYISIVIHCLTLRYLYLMHTHTSSIQKDIYADLWSFLSTQLSPVWNFAPQLPAASASPKLNLCSLNSTLFFMGCSDSLVQNVPPGRKLEQYFLLPNTCSCIYSISKYFHNYFDLIV